MWAVVHHLPASRIASPSALRFANFISEWRRESTIIARLVHLIARPSVTNIYTLVETFSGDIIAARHQADWDACWQ
jgi:hypothetical protein